MSKSGTKKEVGVGNEKHESSPPAVEPMRNDPSILTLTNKTYLHLSQPVQTFSPTNRQTVSMQTSKVSELNQSLAESNMRVSRTRMPSWTFKYIKEDCLMFG